MTDHTCNGEISDEIMTMDVFIGKLIKSYSIYHDRDKALLYARELARISGEIMQEVERMQ